jgi:hypothetical protein
MSKHISSSHSDPGENRTNVDEWHCTILLDGDAHQLLSRIIGDHIKGERMQIQHIETQGIEKRYCVGAFAEDGKVLIDRSLAEIAICEDLLKQLK